MKKYAIWQNGKVIGYVEMPQESARKLNEIKGIGVYLGFDETTAPEKYKEEANNE